MESKQPIKERLEQTCAAVITTHRQEFETQKKTWADLVERYENKLRKTSISYMTDSKVALGGAYALVENAVARMLNRQPKYKYLGRESKDVNPADLYEEFSEYQFTESGAEEELEEVARWGFICGLSGWVMGWKEEKQVTSKDGLQIMGIKINNPVVVEAAKKAGFKPNAKVDEEVTVSNYTFNAIPPYRLIWNIDAKDRNDLRVFGYSVDRYIKDLDNEGYDTEKLKQGIVTDEQYWAKQIEDNKGLTQQQVMDVQKVNVAELYVKYLDGDIYKHSMVTMAGLDGATPVMIQFNERPFDQPFMPMGIFRPVNRPGKFSGFGIVEPVMGILDAEEDSFNVALTALWTDVARPMEYNPQNIMDVDSFEYGARKLVPVRQLGQSVAVMPTPQPNITGVNLMLQYLQRSKQNDSGITDFQTGADQVTGQKTLGEIRIKTAESNARMAKITRNFERQVLEPMGRFALYFNKQFLPKTGKVMYKILGAKGSVLEKAIKSKDVEAIKDVMIVSGSTALVEQNDELQKWTALLGAVYDEEKSLQPVPISKEPIWENLLRQGLLVKDLETYLPNAQEREEEEVGGKMKQLTQAKEENDNPLTARVLPTDIIQIHMPIHQAAAKSGVKSNGQPYSPEEQQALVQHINAHIQASGGVNPAFAVGQEQALNTHIQNQVPQPMPNQPNPTK